MTEDAVFPPRRFTLPGALVWLCGWGAAAVGLGAAGLVFLPFAEPEHWFSDNLSFFLPQLLGIGLAALAVAVLSLAGPHRKRWRLAVATGLLATLLAGAATLTVARTLAVSVDDAEVGDAAKRLRVVSINTATLYLGTPDLLDYLKTVAADVVVLQEATWRWQLRRWEKREGNRRIAGHGPYFEHFAVGPEGDVVVFSRYPIISRRGIDPAVPGVLREVAHREFLDIELDVAGRPVRIVAIHPASPRGARLWEARQAYYRHLSEALRGPAAGTDLPTILIGDWNLSPWSAHFRALLKAGGLKAAFPDTIPQTTRYFADYRLRWLLGAPVDHVAVSPGLGVDRVGIGPDIGSDHLPLLVDIALP
ncbi:endonuclease/exonuclease/phosphatase family protein [Polymorphum gilvum]|uniref:Endonuclease/exonuclease/phosphatase family n=1 Tax=Polymorphum gilvum (strain LMG 25793 / CGMCC 1.9160 / SL003B-26A1) TaxID=991905 RepID=F2J0H4_POLGS|nr:endonuclease/exonuclease/phosphatase family protein [Polymorphum gilvum]ADZ69642.1 Endonuclease/exonuclease/phosphatase family [Polymorphum gilvum SL003B-26A1]